MVRGEHLRRENRKKNDQQMGQVVKEMNNFFPDIFSMDTKRHTPTHYLKEENLFSVDFDVKKHVKDNKIKIVRTLSEDIKEFELSCETNNNLIEIYKTKEELTLKEHQQYYMRECYRMFSLKERMNSLVRTIQSDSLKHIQSSILHPHPVNYHTIKKIFMREPLVSSCIEENAMQRIQPGFHVEVKNRDGKENKEAQYIIEEFVEDPNIKFREFLINTYINYDEFGNAFVQPVIYQNEIVKLFHHDPEYMFVQTDNQRNVLGYWEFGEYQQAHFFPYEIIHWKRNATVENPYGYSVIIPLIEYIKRKLNVWSDAIRALHRYGSPFILWVFGNETIPRIAKPSMDNFMSALKSYTSNDIGAPYGVDAKTLGADFKVALQYNHYLEELRNEMLMKLKTPPVVLGITTSGKSSDDSLEAYDKRNQTSQQVLADNVMIPIFRLLLNLKQTGIRKSIIRVRWNKFDRIERDKKEQNLVKMVINGILTPAEARERIGLTTPLRARDMESGKTYDDFGDYFNILPTGQDQGQGNSSGSPAPTRTSDKNLQTKKNQTKVKK